MTQTPEEIAESLVPGSALNRAAYRKQVAKWIKEFREFMSHTIIRGQSMVTEDELNRLRSQLEDVQQDRDAWKKQADPVGEDILKKLGELRDPMMKRWKEWELKARALQTLANDMAEVLNPFALFASAVKRRFPLWRHNLLTPVVEFEHQSLGPSPFMRAVEVLKEYKRLKKNPGGDGNDDGNSPEGGAVKT